MSDNTTYPLEVSNLTLSQVGSICNSLVECEEGCPLYPVCVEHKKIGTLMPRCTEQDGLMLESLFAYRGDCQIYRDKNGNLFCEDDELPKDLLKPLAKGEACSLQLLRFY